MYTAKWKYKFGVCVHAFVCERVRERIYTFSNINKLINYFKKK